MESPERHISPELYEILHKLARTHDGDIHIHGQHYHTKASYGPDL